MREQDAWRHAAGPEGYAGSMTATSRYLAAEALVEEGKGGERHATFEPPCNGLDGQGQRRWSVKDEARGFICRPTWKRTIVDCRFSPVVWAPLRGWGPEREGVHG